MTPDKRRAEFIWWALRVVPAASRNYTPVRIAVSPAFADCVDDLPARVCGLPVEVDSTLSEPYGLTLAPEALSR